MRFRAEREPMQAALSFVARYADTGPIPIINNVLFEAADNRVFVTATDLNRAARASFAAEIEEAGRVTLPSFLSKAIDGEVSVSADERQAVVQSGKQRLDLPVLPAKDFPDLPSLTGQGKVFTLDGSLLARVTNEVSFAYEKEGGRFYLAGTNWRSSGGKIEFCATDGKALSLLSSECREDMDIIVPIFALPKWEGAVEVTVSDTFIRFSKDGEIVASKLIEGSFPDFHRILPKGGAPLSFDRAELLAAVKKMSLVADKRNNSVLMVGHGGIASISAATEKGSVSVDVPYHGDDFQFAAQSMFLAPVIDSFGCETVEVRWLDHSTGITVHDPKDASRMGMVQPYYDRRLAGLAETKAAA